MRQILVPVNSNQALKQQECSPEIPEVLSCLRGMFYGLCPWSCAGCSCGLSSRTAASRVAGWRMWNKEIEETQMCGDATSTSTYIYKIVTRLLQDVMQHVMQRPAEFDFLTQACGFTFEDSCSWWRKDRNATSATNTVTDTVTNRLTCSVQCWILCLYSFCFH